MKKTISIIGVSVAIILLAGCSNNKTAMPTSSISVDEMGYPIIQPQDNAYPALEQIDTEKLKTLSVIDLPVPKSGKSSLSGVLVNITSRNLMQDVDIYLTRAVGPEEIQVPPILAGAFEDQGDIKGKTNENGQFVFSDIPPGNYFLIVSMDLSIVASADNSTIPLLLRLEPDQAQSLGVVYYTAN